MERPSAVPSAASLLGAVVLVLATAGALTVSPAQAGSSTLASGPVSQLAGHPTELAGSESIARVASTTTLDRRNLALSRDSQRQALTDATHQRLQGATEQQGQQRNAALAALAASAEKQAGLLAKDSWQLPITAGTYQLTARFGECSSHWAHCHTGLDFAAPTGTPIHAVANGTISQTGWAGPYGNRTVMTLKDGTELWYAHQSAIGVKPGQGVVAGQVIGQVGATGNVTGPHVHLEVRPGAGDPVDPYAALIAHGLKP